MDVVIKDWGVQVWHGRDVVMVMRNGTKTSMHKHSLYDTFLKCVSGECFVEAPSGGNMPRGRTLFIPAGVWHQISATTDCVIEEEYIPKQWTRAEPIDDIERMTENPCRSQDMGTFTGEDQCN